MKHVALLTAVLIAFVTLAIAQHESTSHASREAAIQLLRREGIISGNTQVVSAEWSDDAHCSSLSVIRAARSPIGRSMQRQKTITTFVRTRMFAHHGSNQSLEPTAGRCEVHV